MKASDPASAEHVRALLVEGRLSPDAFRRTLTSVPSDRRDPWVDQVLGLDGVVDDGPALPRGCVPYYPCSVDALLRAIDSAGVKASDVFVDIGAGVGRAAMLVHFLTGAAAMGLEVQPNLVATARDLAKRLNVRRFTPIEGDATRMAGHLTMGSVFFLYCPFSGERLETVLDALEPIARARPIRVCCVDVPVPPRPWLTLAAPRFEDVAVYRGEPRS